MSKFIGDTDFTFRGFKGRSEVTIILVLWGYQLGTVTILRLVASRKGGPVLMFLDLQELSTVAMCPSFSGSTAYTGICTGLLFLGEAYYYSFPSYYL